jgi:aldehyde:ferredoxin oxidoreductase
MPVGDERGTGKMPVPPGLKVGTLLRYSHAWFALLGSLGVCARAQVNRFYSAGLCAELYEAVTGIPGDLAALQGRVDTAWTLLRRLNVREGLDPSADALPEQWFQAPGFQDYLHGRPARKEDAEAMIEDYYRAWGWDPVTGEPP